MNEREAFNKVDDWIYNHSINDDYEKIEKELDIIQALVLKANDYKNLIRCAKCKYYGNGHCFIDGNGTFVKRTDFCSRAELKEEK